MYCDMPPWFLYSMVLAVESFICSSYTSRISSPPYKRTIIPSLFLPTMRNLFVLGGNFDAFETSITGCCANAWKHKNNKIEKDENFIRPKLRNHSATKSKDLLKRS